MFMGHYPLPDWSLKAGTPGYHILRFMRDACSLDIMVATSPVALVSGLHAAG